MFPASSTLRGGFQIGGIVRFESGFGTESSRIASQGEVDAEFHVLNDVPGAQFGAADDAPRKGHAAAVEQAGQSQPIEAERANVILERERESGPLFARPSRFRGVGKNPLNGRLPTRRIANQPIERVRMRPSVGIDEHHHFGRTSLKVPKPKIEGETFAAPFEIVPFDGFRSRLSCNGRGFVRAIVGHDDDPIAGLQL